MLTQGSFILDLDGHELSDEERRLLKLPQVAGVILFSRNIADLRQLKALTASIKSVRPDLLITVDQEGGRVQRCRDGFTRLPPMQALGRAYEDRPEWALQLATELGWLMASELLSVGIDFSFAPVLDVDSDYSSVIGDRSFSPNPAIVTRLAEALITGMQQAGMATVGKHFPGHGSVVADSHLELPVDTRPFSAIQSHDLMPFVTLLPKLQGIMPAHIVFSAVDSQPVGFSVHWLQQVLRQQMGFGGVIFSDDLSMAGAAVAGGYAARSQAALAAGCDVLIACNHREGALAVIDDLVGRQVEPCRKLSPFRPPVDTRGLLDTSERWCNAVKMIELLD